MHVAVIGAGAMGACIVGELALREPGLTLTVIDADGARAEALALRSGLPGARGRRCDARDVAALARALSGASATINAAQYDTNLDVMRACIGAGSHYLDLGGMFHMTRRQLALGADFAAAGLTAVLGMGAAPGLTNLLAAVACEGLERVDRVDLAFAATAVGAPASEVFVPPYSIRTIMQEFCETSIQFIDGELCELPALSGRQRIVFPEPIGAVECVHTLHSEPATLPQAFAEAGIRHVTWRLGLPPELDGMVRAFAAAGLGRATPLAVGGAAIAPVDFLAASIEDQLARRPLPTTPYTECGCVRAEACGAVEGRSRRVVVECLLEVHGPAPDMAGVITGTPAAIAGLMLARGEARLTGAHGPERALPPLPLLGQLAERGFRTTLTEHRPLP